MDKINQFDEDGHAHGYWIEENLNGNNYHTNYKHGNEVGLSYLISPNGLIVAKHMWDDDGYIIFTVRRVHGFTIYNDNKEARTHIEEEY